jgi:hypothetical protein
MQNGVSRGKNRLFAFVASCSFPQKNGFVVEQVVEEKASNGALLCRLVIANFDNEGAHIRRPIMNKSVLIVQVISTIILGTIATYAAVQQWRTTRNQFRLAFYDRRFAVYMATGELAVKIVKAAEVSVEEVFNFAVKTKEASFIFGEDIERYCDEMRDKAMKLAKTGNLNRVFNSEKDRNESLHVSNEIIQWFNTEIDQLPRRFKPYLRIRD